MTKYIFSFPVTGGKWHFYSGVIACIQENLDTSFLMNTEFISTSGSGLPLIFLTTNYNVRDTYFKMIDYMSSINKLNYFFIYSLVQSLLINILDYETIFYKNHKINTLCINTMKKHVFSNNNTSMKNYIKHIITSCKIPFISFDCYTIIGRKLYIDGFFSYLVSKHDETPCITNIENPDNKVIIDFENEMPVKKVKNTYRRIITGLYDMENSTDMFEHGYNSCMAFFIQKNIKTSIQDTSKFKTINKKINHYNLFFLKSILYYSSIFLFIFFSVIFINSAIVFYIYYLCTK